MLLEGLSPDWVQQPTNQNENEALKKLDRSFKLKVMSEVFAADTLCCIACEQRRISDGRFSPPLLSLWRRESTAGNTSASAGYVLHDGWRKS